MHVINEWCHSVKGEKIELFSSLELKNLSKFILFVGGVHGDEPEGINLANNLLTYLQNNTTSKDWALITCLNPDGAKISQRTNANGVDLNRNFPSLDWSPEFTKKRYYPGSQAGSEPEAKALSELVQTQKPELVVHFHSWKPSIILTGPEGYLPAQLFSQSSNYELMHDIGYPTPGSLGQFCWQNYKIPVICIEEAEHVDADESWNRFQPAFKSLLNKSTI